ncbi:hypothetical protein PM3016_5461 [Paenibacillus mucilaginosus 3016]|uniref:Uncharacterized protein n=1 Tax=Paenibacillus mucilaginosus 3016 TaxID=1116391 RepID=H6NDW2_9BACL|nr:hypothetical protein [Paenibacillus mucilaginosus]AFC32161.1 hypothetical protein PM3016_5461 [Paenibacillus mucilaginosus 3016]
MSSFPYEERILELKEHEQEIIVIKGRAFIITPATLDDVERITSGMICID